MGIGLVMESGAMRGMFTAGVISYAFAFSQPLSAIFRFPCDY